MNDMNNKIVKIVLEKLTNSNYVDPAEHIYDEVKVIKRKLGFNITELDIEDFLWGLKSTTVVDMDGVVEECIKILETQIINKNTKNMKREEVYKAIDSERDYQDFIWNSETTASNGIHSPEEWFMYIEDYVNEAKSILSRQNVQTSYPISMDIMRKVAAMAVCAMEQNEVKKRIF